MKPPAIMTFIIATLLAGVAVASHLGVAVPMAAGMPFWVLFAAFALLVLGVITRGL